MCLRKHFLLMCLLLLDFCCSYTIEWISNRLEVCFYDFVGDEEVLEFEQDFSMYDLHEAPFSSSKVR